MPTLILGYGATAELEFGCYVDFGVRTPEDGCRETIALTRQFGWSKDANWGDASENDDLDTLIEACDYGAIPYLNEITKGGYWTQCGERGGLFLDDPAEDIFEEIMAS